MSANKYESFRPAVETLEDRCLLSAGLSAQLPAGVLSAKHHMPAHVHHVHHVHKIAVHHGVAKMHKPTHVHHAHHGHTIKVIHGNGTGKSQHKKVHHGHTIKVIHGHVHKPMHGHATDKE
jgi:hypothetical protein